MADRLEQVPLTERREILLQAVLEEVAHVLRLGSQGSVRKRDRLMEIGLDSLMALDLSRRLATRLGRAEMPATLMFDYPTPEAIAEYILQRMGQDESGVSTMEAEVVMSAESPLLSEEEVLEMSDEAVAELLRNRLDR
jgi:acyl carrier protein